MRNMTKRRRYMLSSEKVPRVPEEYQEVAWLRGTGTQYFRLPYSLGFSGEHFYGMIGDIEKLTGTQYSYLRIASENQNPSSIYYYSWGVNAQYNFCEAGLLSGSQSSNNLLRYNESLVYHFEINKNNIKINNSILNNPAYNNTGLGDDIYVGSYVNTSGSRVVSNLDVLIKGIKLTYDDNVYCEFIPCYRKADNKAGLFYWIDYSQGTSGFITNSGSGSDFIIGPDV